jgi:hypothetical protein
MRCRFRVTLYDARAEGVTVRRIHMQRVHWQGHTANEQSPGMMHGTIFFIPM